MASVLTDQFVPGSVITPLAPITTTATSPQFILKFGRQGAASVQLPLAGDSLTLGKPLSFLIVATGNSSW